MEWRLRSWTERQNRAQTPVQLYCIQVRSFYDWSLKSETRLGCLSNRLKLLDLHRQWRFLCSSCCFWREFFMRSRSLWCTILRRGWFPGKLTCIWLLTLTTMLVGWRRLISTTSVLTILFRCSIALVWFEFNDSNHFLHLHFSFFNVGSMCGKCVGFYGYSVVGWQE